MGGSRIWSRVTGVAVLGVPIVVVAARFSVPGWILAFAVLFAAPVWVFSYGLGVWMARGMLSDRSALAAAPVLAWIGVVGAQWVYLAGLVFFGLFMSDGGDADDWQSPIGLLLGVDGYNSATPEYLNRAQEFAMPALLGGFAVQLAAALGYLVLVARHRRAGAEVTPAPTGAMP